MLIGLLASLMLCSLIACSSKNVKEVTVYAMENFSDIQEGSIRTITDSKDLSIIRNTIQHATKQSGIVNVVEPRYKVEWGEEAYFLWINEASGTLMNVKDTHTLYSIAKKSHKDMYDLIVRLYNL